ncbi:hypothetical protein ACFXKK_05175 [Streptomyces globisporus]
MDPAVRAAIEITPAAGTRDRIVDITTTAAPRNSAASDRDRTDPYER